MRGITSEFLGSAAPEPHEACREYGAELVQTRWQMGLGGESLHGWHSRSGGPTIEKSANYLWAKNCGYKVEATSKSEALRAPVGSLLRSGEMMSDETDKARDKLARIYELFVKHADEWVCILECWWKISQNPVFVWKAGMFLFHPSRPTEKIPEWVKPYLYWISGNLNEVFHLEPTEAKSMMGQALGLLSPSRSVIADADKLLEGPVFIAIYNSLLKQAPVSQRSAWAHSEMRKMFRLPSDEVVRQRLLEARKTMQAFVIARGQVADTGTVDQTCDRLCELQALVSGIFNEAQIPTPTSEEVRAEIGSPIPRRAAIEAFLEQAEKEEKARKEEEARKEEG